MLIIIFWLFCWIWFGSSLCHDLVVYHDLLYFKAEGSALVSVLQTDCGALFKRGLINVTFFVCMWPGWLEELPPQLICIPKAAKLCLKSIAEHLQDLLKYMRRHVQLIALVPGEVSFLFSASTIWENKTNEYKKGLQKGAIRILLLSRCWIAICLWQIGVICILVFLNGCMTPSIWKLVEGSVKGKAISSVEKKLDSEILRTGTMGWGK